MGVVVLVVVSSVRVWLGVLRGRSTVTSRETPFVETGYAT